MRTWGIVVRNILDRGNGQCKGGGYFLKEKGTRERLVGVGEI